MYKKSKLNNLPIKGKVLQVQYGYNANSGSIASFIVAMPVVLMVAITALGSLTAVVFTILLNKKFN